MEPMAFGATHSPARSGITPAGLALTARTTLHSDPGPRVAMVNEGLMAALEGVAYGVALLRADSTLLYANAAARAALRGAGWSVTERTVHSGEVAERSAWSDALIQVCNHSRRRLLELHTSSGPVYAVLVPVLADGRRVAFVSFGRSELCSAVEMQLFASRHGLTCAESQVLRQMTLGLRPADIAREHRVAISTVASQIASIRAKTHCKSVRELLDKLSRMPSLRSAAAHQGLLDS